jgi:GT2 family glycosyltransferase
LPRHLEELKQAGGSYIALLNNDAEPDEMAWWLVKAAETHPEVGICASKIMVYGSDRIDSAGDGFSLLLKSFKRRKRVFV